MSEFIWPEDGAILALHEEMIVEFGGRPGTCNRELLATEIKRPINMTLFEEPDIAALAAAYGAGFARHPPFKDGSVRSAFVVMNLFLSLNGYRLMASDKLCVDVMRRAVTGEMEELPLAEWLREHIVPTQRKTAKPLAREARVAKKPKQTKTTNAKGASSADHSSKTSRTKKVARKK
jgi:death on curing protein